MRDDVDTRGVRDRVSAEEWRKRVDLAACYRLIHLFGMDEMIANHVTARVPGEDNAFLINPYGYLYDQMHASCMVKVDLDGDILLDPTGLGINRAGYVVHSAIHGARHDVDCVIHTHTIAGMAVSAMKCGLLPIAQTSMRHAKIAYHAYEGVALNLDERAGLIADLGAGDALILKNHGLLTTGETIAAAFDAMFRLERACQTQVAALSCNVEIELPAPEIVEATWKLYQPGVRRRPGEREWPALLKRLDAIDPSFRA